MRIHHAWETQKTRDKIDNFGIARGRAHVVLHSLPIENITSYSTSVLFFSFPLTVHAAKIRKKRLISLHLK
jgi:hypothetical protein